MSHINNVVRYSKLIAKKEGGDGSVCVAASYLHDIGYSVDEKTHREHSERISKRFLKGIGVHTGVRNAILHCIHCHDQGHGNEAGTIEAKIVHDSDRLQVLGAQGFQRMFWYFVEKKNLNPKEAIDKIISMQKKFTGSLKTQTAVEIAKMQNRCMEAFYKDLKGW